MREWLTAREIAAEALPQMPGTERGVSKVVDRLGWNESLAHARPREGRGGGMEFNIALLPTSARLAYEARHRRVAQLELPIAPAAPSNLSDRGREERDARLAIVAAYDAHARGQRMSQASLTQIFVDRYNARTLTVDPWVLERVPSLSKRSLTRWRAAKAAQAIDRLAVDPSMARKGTGLLDVANGGRVRTFMLALLAHQPHASAHHVRKLVRSEFGDALVDRHGDAAAMPPVRTFQHALKGLRTSEKVALTKLTNPDLYRSTMAPRGTGSNRHVTTANQLWQIDASPVDALCVDGRHAIYACIDIATRRSLFYLSKTPKASAVALLIRKAVLTWGAPTVIKIDNGSDFVARDTKRLFTSLGIEVDLSPAYTPQAKAHVERLIGTFQREVGPMLPGYVGHSVADRKAIEDRKSFADRLGADTAEQFGVTLTGPQLQAYVDEWVRVTYEHHPHAGLGGQTPFQAAAACGAARRTVDPRALDILLMPVADGGGVRTVTAQGVRIAGFHYFVNAALPGHRVLLRMDPNDSGRAVAFDVDHGGYVGEAICAELAGIDPRQLLAAQKAATAEILHMRMGEARAEVKKLTKGRPLIERVLDVDRRDMPQNIVAFPKREEVHTTAEIMAALDAARAAPPPPMSPQAAAEHARLIAIEDADEARQVVEAVERVAFMSDARQADIAARAHLASTTVRALPEQPKERFRRAIIAENAMADGAPLEPLEAFWLAGYQRGSEYLGLMRIYEIEGPDWLAF